MWVLLILFVRVQGFVLNAMPELAKRDWSCPISFLTMSIMMEVGQHLFGSCCFLVKVSSGCVVSLFGQSNRHVSHGSSIFGRQDCWRHLSGVSVTLLVQGCHCLGGGVSSFWGSLFLFWQRQCCLFGDIIVLAETAASLGGRFVGSICLVAVLHRFSSDVFVWGTASSFWGGGLLFWRGQCCLFWWWQHHGENLNFVLYETLLHIHWHCICIL